MAEIKRTISGMSGKGSIAHNERRFIAENVDRERTCENVTLVSENIKDVYHELFDAALGRYNAKQKRKDRMIEDYYEHIRLGKQEKLFHEVIFQIGNKDNMACQSMEGEIAKEILLEFAKEFQKRNPQLRVFGIYLHMDEATPHLHIDFVPYMTGSKRGLDTRVSMKQALASRGFVSKGREETERDQWMLSEKQELAKVAERYGVIWEEKGTHEEHLDVLNFKKKKRREEIAVLEDQIQDKKHEMERLENSKISKIGELQDLEEEKRILQSENADYKEISEQRLIDLEVIEERIQKISAEKKKAEQDAENALQKAVKQEKRLEKATTIAWDITRYAGEFSKSVDEIVPDPTVLESAKTYRKNKVIPVFLKLRNLLYGLYMAYIRIKEQAEQIQYRYDRLKLSNEQLAKKNQYMENEIDEYYCLRRALGNEQTDNMIRSQRQLEEKEYILRKTKKKLYGMDR